MPTRVRRGLEAIVGVGHVRWTDGDVAPYSRDATPLFSARPDAVVLPGSTAEVAAVLKLASQHGLPVVPRGAGSNLCAGTVPLAGGIVLVLTRLDAIHEVSAEELLTVAQAGATTAAVSAAAGEKGLLFARPAPAVSAA